MNDTIMTTPIGDLPINSDGMRKLVDEYDQLASKTKWRDFSKEQPDKDGLYLVYYEYSPKLSPTLKSYTYGILSYNKEDNDWFAHYWVGLPERILYWMPLPPKPHI